DAAPMADEAGEIPAGRIGRHGPVLRIEIETTEVLGRQSSEQGFGTLPGRDPLLFHRLEIHRTDQVLALQVAILIAGVAIRELEDERRRVSLILAASGPDHGAEAQILPVELEDVEEIPDLGSPDQREHLVRRQVRRMQAVAEVLIR